MVSVSYQTIFNTKCDFKKRLTSIISESFEDNYISYDEVTLESTLLIKYVKVHSGGRYIVGFNLEFDEEPIWNIEPIVNSVGEKLNDNKEVIVAFKFDDSNQFTLLSRLYEELYHIEMKLREAISFIFVDTYKDNCYDLLRDIDLIPQFERKTNLRRDEVERKTYLKKRLENEFFHILFPDYYKLTQLKPLKQSDLFFIAEISNNFDEFKGNIVNRGVRKEEHLNLLNSIKEDMQSLDAVRNCVAHSRTPIDEELVNYERSLGELNQKLDDFLVSLSNSS